MQLYATLFQFLFLPPLLGITLPLVAQEKTGLTPKIQTPKILVGPNVHVSRDSDLLHWETMIAAHPTDPNVLIGSSSVAGRSDDLPGKGMKVYVTRDRGYSWRVEYVPGYNTLGFRRG